MPHPNIRINQRSGETKTEQIFNQLASAILAGKFSAGDLITSERELAERLGVSRNIVRNAYRRLEEAGLIETSSTTNRRVRATGAQRAPGAAGVDHEDRVTLSGPADRAQRRTGAAARVARPRRRPGAVAVEGSETEARHGSSEAAADNDEGEADDGKEGEGRKDAEARPAKRGRRPAERHAE